MRKALALAGLVLLGGCSTTKHYSDELEPRAGQYICIINEDVHDWRVYANSTRLGFVHAGDSEIVRIPPAMMNQPMTLRLTSGSGNSRRVPVRLGMHKFWKWTLSVNRYFSGAGPAPSRESAPCG